jgi:hypothetical protein
VADAQRWRATFVALRKENRLESAQAQVATSLRRWHILPRRSPDAMNYRVSVRTSSLGGSNVATFKPMRDVVFVDVVQTAKPANQAVVISTGRLDTSAKAREALRQKLRELDEMAATQQVTNASR